MKWTKEDTDFLLSFKDTTDNDDVKVKEKIKRVLLDNRYIVHALNNKELEQTDAEPEDYFGVNIVPYYVMQPIQHNVNNYICYEVTCKEIDKYNANVKELLIVFYIISVLLLS